MTAFRTVTSYFPPEQRLAIAEGLRAWAWEQLGWRENRRVQMCEACGTPVHGLTGLMRERRGTQFLDADRLDSLADRWEARHWRCMPLEELRIEDNLATLARVSDLDHASLAVMLMVDNWGPKKIAAVRKTIGAQPQEKLK